MVGAQLSVVAVPTQIYQLTGSSAWVGLTGLFGLVPLIVFGLWGGAIADAVDRRVLLLVTGAGIAVSSLALWVTATSGIGGVWTVLVLFSVQTAFLAVNQPTRSAVLPRLLPAAELPAANALNMTVVQAGAIAGPLLAGVLIPLIGLPTLYLLDAIALLATLWATWRLPAVPPEPNGGARRRAGHPRGGRRVPVRGHAQGAAGVVPDRRGRDGLRHAPGGVPGDVAHRVRGPDRRRDGARAAVRRDPDGHGRRPGCSPAGCTGSAGRASR